MNTRNVCSLSKPKVEQKVEQASSSASYFFFCFSVRRGRKLFFGLFPLVYERKTLEMSLWPAETRTLPLRTFRFRGMIIVHRFSGSAPVPP